MAAPDRGLRHRGQEARYRQAGLRFQHGGQHLVQTGLAVIEQDARHMAVCAEVLKAFDLGRQRHAVPLGCTTSSTGRPSVSASSQALARVLVRLTIIKAHSALAHGGTMPGGIAGKNGPHHIPVGKKQIQIVAVHLQSRAVEHGVDVVRPAFERTGVGPALFFSAASTAQATVVLPLPEEGAAMRNCIICVYP